MNIDSSLKKEIGKEITLTYIGVDGILYYVSGIINKITPSLIEMTVFSKFGKLEDFSLNRYSCTLMSWTVDAE